MKRHTYDRLWEAHQFCVDLHKSTEFEIQYLQDEVGVNLDCVIKFLESIGKIKTEEK